ncbi:MAG: peptidase associated/transthyretin-like domain-containing protein, partial [Planctomycetota bacterium]
MRNTAFLSLAVAAAFHFAGPVLAAPAAGSERGKIAGVVVEAATGKPIIGAYVGVGDFGDSGGSNYSRHSEQGLFAKARTDAQGRFVLEGLAFQDHPLVVTHPDFVRHDLAVTLLKGALEPDIRIGLKPAAKIDVTVVDSSGEPLEGIW